MKSSGNTQEEEALSRMCLRPVGVIRNRVVEPSLVADSGDLKCRGTVETLREELNEIT